MTEPATGIHAGPQPVDWERLLFVYMHDPVDKALDVRGHEARAARYASRALGREVDRSEIEDSATFADQLAATAERIPMPTAGAAGETDGHAGRFWGVAVMVPFNGGLKRRRPWKRSASLKTPTRVVFGRVPDRRQSARFDDNSTPAA